MLRVVVFDQTSTLGTALGPWCLMEVSMEQLITALVFPVGARHPPSVRIYDLDGEPWRAVSLSLVHSLHWSSRLEGQRELSASEAAALLASGSAIQLFIFNGDSDCVRHHVVLPLGEPVSWLP